MVSSGQGAAFQRLQDLGDLGAVVGGDDEIVSRLQGHHRHGPVGAVRCNCLHGQIIGHHHAVKAQVRPQQAVDLRGQGGGGDLHPQQS